MTKEQEVFEKVNRIRIDFFDSKYKDVHTDDELEEKYEALGDVLNMLKEKDKEIEKQDKMIDAMAILMANMDIDEEVCKHQVATFCDDKPEGVTLDVCAKCIKQYFKRKCEEC